MFKDYFSPKELQIIQNNIFSSIRENSGVFLFLKELWETNFDSIGFKHLATHIFDIIENCAEKSDDEVIQSIEVVLQDRDFKKQARQTRKFDYKPRMLFQYELIKNYLEDIDSFLDYGCGKMALIRKICKENKSIKNLYGYDPKSSPELVQFDERAVFVDSLFELDKLRNLDLVYTSFVFHHLDSDEIKDSLQRMDKVLKKAGKLIFIEESFFETEREKEYQNSQDLIKGIGFKSQNSTNNLFNSLNIKDKFLSIYLNDVLINLKNLTYMPWTFEYRTIENWKVLLEQNNFKVKEVFDFGVVDSGRLKQGVTSMIISTKE